MIKTYQANWYQSSTAAPVDKFLQNTAGNYELTRESQGAYRILFDLLISDLDKVVVTIPGIELNNNFAYDYHKSIIDGKLCVYIYSRDASWASNELPTIGSPIDDAMLTGKPLPVKIEIFQ